MSIDVDKKSGRGRPKVESDLVCARIAQPLLGQLDAWCVAQPDQPARPEAVRRILGKHLNALPSPGTKLSDQIAQKEIIGGLPRSDSEPSPEAAMNVMRRAVAENDLIEMKNVGHRTKRPLA